MATDNLLNMSVKDVMTTELHVALMDDTMESVANQLIQHKINHVPVVDTDGNLQGIVTRNDLELLKDWGTEIGLPLSEKKNLRLLSTSLASERMSEILVTVSPEDTLGHCASIFLDNVFHALPVVEGEKLVGIITTYDLLRIAYQ